jgi:hypothetical protein
MCCAIPKVAIIAGHRVSTAGTFNRERRLLVHEGRMPVRHLTMRAITDHSIDGGQLLGIARRL